ncbi:hypothetical protein FCS83_07430 [Oenococcus sp. UCMA 17063]|nr:hypothetical protein [Oenococcus sp. UCMA 17063]
MSDSQNFTNRPTSSKQDYIEAAEVIEKVFKGSKPGMFQTLIDLMADNAVIEFPFAPLGRPQRVEGKSNIIKYSKAVLGIAPITGYTDIEIHRTTDPDCVIVEMKGHGNVAATGNDFERRYVDVLHTKNGRIQFIREYWNPQESPTVKK